MTAFARPEDYAALDDVPAVDAQVQALNRIATALEQIALELADRPATGLAPLPPVRQAPAPNTPPPPVASAAALPTPPTTAACPVHNLPWKLVPAGITKSGPRAGQPYGAFYVCQERGCSQRPS